MKHYINPETNEIFAYESDGSQDKYIKPGLVYITDDDLAILRSPTKEQIAKEEQKKINAEAQAFLSECDWKRQRHISQKALGIATSLSDEEYLAMEQECQAARDRIVK